MTELLTVNYIRSYTPPPISNFLSHPSPILGFPNRYEAEEILAHKGTVAQGREYLVKWLGWPEGDSTWEKETHLADYWASPRDVSRGQGGNVPTEVVIRHEYGYICLRASINSIKELWLRHFNSDSIGTRPLWYYDYHG
jgi:hypothetical protein